ncbi:MAG TPA: hypothetical protein VME66_02130, partial [Candidatus Acidoferrales bacterium]|nr:hypothetical protein [Candidatus Acidoferrales bacterium]
MSFFDLAVADESGLASDPELPYNLRGVDFLRAIQDIHQLLHESNVLLNSRGLPPLEDLHDPAGFSGLLSRIAAERLSRQSRQLTPNKYHNGFPDLIPVRTYPDDKVKAGDKGLEIKTSRYDAGWQGHSVREGWFCVLQFGLDDPLKTFATRAPTQILAVMATRIGKTDWNVHRAGDDKDRSGTTQMKPVVTLGMRRNAIWVNPQYRSRHEHLLRRLEYEAVAAPARKIYVLKATDLAARLDVTRAQLKSRLSDLEDSEGLYFDFGLGKTKS